MSGRSYPAFDVDADKSDDDGDGQDHKTRIVAHKIGQDGKQGHDYKTILNGFVTICEREKNIFTISIKRKKKRF